MRPCLAAFSVAAGLLVVVIDGSVGFSALPGPFLGIAGVIAVMAVAVGRHSVVHLRGVDRQPDRGGSPLGTHDKDTTTAWSSN